MKKIFLLPLLLISFMSWSQDQKIIDAIINEATNNSQLEILAHQLTDKIGPRLVGSPEMQQAHDWVVNTYQGWGITGRNEQWGTWRNWQRGITHVDLIHPRRVELTARQLAWSTATKKPIEAEAVAIPVVKSKAEFDNWLKTVKGKIVLINPTLYSGRPESNWKEYATDSVFNEYKTKREAQYKEWRDALKAIESGVRELPGIVEAAGAVAVINSQASDSWGAVRIFGADTKNIPMISMNPEDYGMIYRLAKFSSKPKLKINVENKTGKPVPTYNSIGEIRGTEKPDEYVVLSAHLDSWDGGTGATDNATGTILLMETMRILKKFYPNPKRTIIAGHWGSEEQGLNGSRAYVQDHMDMMPKIQAVFNQDNGTGRFSRISGMGFLHAYDFMGRWMKPVPEHIRNEVETIYPGIPSGGGSDYASFLAAGVPAFFLLSNSWDYGNYTWHTQLDTYDKIVFEEVRNNAIMLAIMTYMACEEPELVDRERIKMPINERTGELMTWPEVRDANRKGGQD
ncbi:MAG: M20/M25/M40 family metallo-hydrolase [Flavobacteriaceae bacterium]|nr:M20/M25/M40 family metallo-hydrolase [Flavobacteriaceae bacterium]